MDVPMSYTNPDRSCVGEFSTVPDDCIPTGCDGTDSHDSSPAWQRTAAVVQRRFGRSSLMLAAWMTSIPSVGFAQNCLQWEYRTKLNTASPSPRSSHAMAYDSLRKVTVLFGGPYGYYNNGDTWEWNGTTWTQRPTTGPSPRYAHAMAYDSARHVTVLFGGYDGSFKGDTWEWDGATWTQRSTTGPSPRYAHAMAYDSARHVTVLFGGLDDSSIIDGSDDTWEWNGTTWTPRNTTGPSARHGHRMAYDSVRRVTVLFGGRYPPYFYDDTWEWNGTTWTPRIATAPSPRNSHAMAFDSARGVTVLFGGWAGSYFFDGDTWEWDGTTWTLRSMTGPSPRYLHAMAYDSARDVTLLFGGFDDYDTDGYRGDTWELVNCANPCALFDGDCDGDRDLQDIAAFQMCYSSGFPVEPTCARFDESGDEGVDLADFAGLRDALTGPIPPPGP